MSKHLVDIDEQKLGAARAELGTSTIKDTIDEALSLATADRTRRVTEALSALAALNPADRDDAWR